MSQQQKPPSVVEVYELINRAYPFKDANGYVISDPAIEQMREKEYDDVVQSELDKFIVALKRANERNLDTATFMATLYAQGKLQDLFAVLFMSAKSKHRVQISYLYDELNRLFERTKNTVEKQGGK